ncbi:hypothetical protein ACFUYE_32735, partial [Micromonospora humida]|uniref:hypothetical protein n=1 Tax=Micromonospora humida TaxID=2809018 RepID=UPI003672DC7E
MAGLVTGALPVGYTEHPAGVRPTRPSRRVRTRPVPPVAADAPTRRRPGRRVGPTADGSAPRVSLS